MWWKRRLGTLIAVAAACAFVWPARAVPTNDAEYSTPKPPHRLALVIGNSDYTNFAPLPGSKLDADRMEATLKGLGFEVTRVRNMESPIEFETLVVLPFKAKINEGDFVVVYYSGHGFSYMQHNWIVPIHAPTLVYEKDVDTTFLPESAIRGLLGQKKPGVTFVFFDACREYGGGIVEQGGTGIPKGPQTPQSVDKDTIVGFASTLGMRAGSAPDTPSVYTTTLSDQLELQGVEFDTVRKQVTDAVYMKTHGQQLPSFSDIIITNVYFRPSNRIRDDEYRSWKEALDSGDPAKVDRFLRFDRVGSYSAAAREWLADHAGETPVGPVTRVSPLAAELAWNTDGPVTFTRMPASITVPRELNLLDTGQQPEADTRYTDVNRLLELQGKFYLQKNIYARSIDTGMPIEFVRNVALSIFSARGEAIRAVQGNIATGFEALLGKLGENAPSILVGRPLAEIMLAPPTGGLRTVVDEKPLEEFLDGLRSDGHQVEWVSIATAKAETEREQGFLDMQALDAKYILEQSGISESRITTVEGLASLPAGVRVRVYGH
jgi:hypothetical protein